MRRSENKFGITDAGEFVENNYICAESSSLYGKLIGRRKVVPPVQKSFTTADIVLEGYLKKEGSWRKSWKTRYFILRKDIRTLCIFASKDDYALIGAIPVDTEHVVYGEVRNNDDNEHLFGIKPTNSDKPSILLSAPDDATKRLWLDALAQESMREDEVVASDWWTDLFGDVPVMDGRVAGEIMRLRRRNGESDGDLIGKLARCDARAECTDSPTCTSQAIPDDLDHSEDVPGVDRLALMNFTEGGGGGEEGDVDSVRLAMPDQDSDDELDNTLPAPPAMGRGGSTQFVEGNRSQSGEPSSAAPALGTETSTESQASHVNSDDRTRVNSSANSGDHGTSSTSVSGASQKGLSTPKPKEKKQGRDHIKKVLENVKASELKDSKQKAVSPAPLQYPSADRHDTTHGFAGMKLSIRIENMCQYMDRFFIVIFAGQPTVVPPATSTGTDHEDVVPQLAADSAAATASSNTAGKGGTDGGSSRPGSSFTWRPLSRTEEVTIEEKPEYGESVIRVISHQFSILQGPVETDPSSHLMLILFRNEQQTGGGGTGYNFASHVIVSKTIIKRNILNTPSGLFKYDMSVVSDRFMDLSSSPWMAQKSKVTVGVTVMSSPKIAVGRLLLHRQLGERPYGETSYGLQSSSGQVLALEDMFVSRYGILVPQSFLGLIFVERMQHISDACLVAADDSAQLSRNLKELTNNVLKDYFADMTTVPPKPPTRLFIQPSSYNQFSDPAPDSLGITELTTRANNLKKLCTTLQGINQIIFEFYENSYRHYLKISAGGTLRNAVIDNSCGGSHLRRSIWKKTPTWQFAPVNLNVQILMTQVIPRSALKDNSETLKIRQPTTTGADKSKFTTHRPATKATARAATAVNGTGDEHEGVVEETTEDVEYFPSLTHGAFAAHSLGYHDGGLRRIFSKIVPEEAKLEWMQVLQSSGGIRYTAIEPLLRQYPEHGEALFSLSSHQDDPAELYSRAFHIALRIDICLSQALAHAVTSLRVLILMASLRLPEYIDKLKCALVAGLLIPIESLLSSQGHEMGMIEDLDGILPLLNSVSFRFVKPPPAPSLPAAASALPPHIFSGGGGSNSNNGSPLGTPRGSSYSNPEGGVATPVHATKPMLDVAVHRDIAGALVVDICVSPEEEAVIRECAAASLGYDDWSTSSAYRFERACKPKESPRCNYKIGHIIPDVIASIGVCAIVLTQGVNEMQTLANMSGEAYKQSLINVDSVKKLKGYITGYIDVVRYYQWVAEEGPTASTPTEQNQAVGGNAANSTNDNEHNGEIGGGLGIKEDTAEEIIRLFKELEKTVQTTVHSPNEKNVNVLLNASRIGRFIAGFMSILCKSGKDRTSMSVTLEQVRYLIESRSVVAGGQELCRVMRRHGVRRMNVWANTGQSLYAFNSIQRQILPTCYCPPVGTFSGSVAT